jgi:glc operon protein GlcG
MSRMLALMSRMLALACALAAFALAVGPASAQQPAGTQQHPPPPPYGPPITLEQAKRVMAAAELEAAKNSWQVAIAILDSGGNMVMFHKLDNTQLASIGASEGKANACCGSSYSRYSFFWRRSLPWAARSLLLPA